ncbi:hypothetical protein DACRYDRAFT_84738, partial [Dacryopinax primogenitus]
MNILFHFVCICICYVVFFCWWTARPHDTRIPVTVYTAQHYPRATGRLSPFWKPQSPSSQHGIPLSLSWKTFSGCARPFLPDQGDHFACTKGRETQPRRSSRFPLSSFSLRRANNKTQPGIPRQIPHAYQLL